MMEDKFKKTLSESLSEILQEPSMLELIRQRLEIIHGRPVELIRAD